MVQRSIRITTKPRWGAACCAPTNSSPGVVSAHATGLVGWALIVYVYVFGVDHVFRLFAGRSAACRARSVATCARTCGVGLCGARGFVGLVENFRDLMQRLLQVFRRRAQARYAAFGDGFPRVFDRVFDG